MSRGTDKEDVGIGSDGAKGMNELHSRLQSCGVNRYYFIDDNDASRQLSVPVSNGTVADVTEDARATSLAWTQRDDLSTDAGFVHVKTLIWEVVYPHPHTSDDDPPVSTTIFIAVALRNGDRVDVNYLRSVLESDLRWDGTNVTLHGDGATVMAKDVVCRGRATAPMIVRMADRPVAERLSGFVSGCIPPMCHSVPIPLFVDEGLVRHIHPTKPTPGDDTNVNGDANGVEHTTDLRNYTSFEDYLADHPTSSSTPPPLVSVGSGTPGLSLRITLRDVLHSATTFPGDDSGTTSPNNPVRIRLLSTGGSSGNGDATIIRGRAATGGTGTTPSGPPAPFIQATVGVKRLIAEEDPAPTPDITPGTNNVQPPPQREPPRLIGRNRDVLLAVRSRVFARTAQTSGKSSAVRQMIEGMGPDFPLLMRVGTRIELDNGKRRVIETEKNAMHYAAWKGDIGTIDLLIGAGERWRDQMDGEEVVNTVSTGKGNYGKSPIFFAITQCRDDVVLHLVNNGANLLIVNNKGQTPCSTAVNHLNPDTCRILFDKEATQLQNGGSFADYRSTHSDGRKYGDLDPRFLRDGDVNHSEGAMEDIAKYRESRAAGTTVDGDGVGTVEEGGCRDAGFGPTVQSGPLPRSVRQTTVWKKEQELLAPEDREAATDGKKERGSGHRTRGSPTKRVQEDISEKKKKTVMTSLDGDDVDLDDLDVLTLADVLPPSNVVDNDDDNGAEDAQRYEYIGSKEDIPALRAAIEESIRTTAEHANGDTTTPSLSNDLSTVQTSWGIDCEWEPSRTSNQNPVATLQLGTSHRAFVVDLQTLCQNNLTDPHTELTATETLLSETLTMLFASPTVVKLGFGISQDLLKLPASFPHLQCFRAVASVLDLQSMGRIVFPNTEGRDVGSLRKMVAVLLGRALDKTEQ